MVLRVVRILCSGFAMKTLGGRRSEEAAQMNQLASPLTRCTWLKKGEVTSKLSCRLGFDLDVSQWVMFSTRYQDAGFSLAKIDGI